MSRKVRTAVSGRIVRLMAASIVAASTAACAASNSGTGPGTAPSPTWTAATTRGCVVGAAWRNAAEGDVAQFVDEALQAAIPPVFGSFSYRARDARSMSETQLENIDELVRNGASVLIITPSTDGGELPAVKRAVDAGIPVIVLGEPIAARSLFIGFDQVEAGRQEARAMLALKPKGKYALVGGPDAGSASDPIAAGIREVLQPAADRGDITMATIASPWEASPAETVSTILNQTGGQVDAVLSEYGKDWIWKALEEAGVADKITLAGVDANNGSDGLFGIARGKQAVDVWENGELIAAAVTRAAIALCHDPDIARVGGSASVTWPGHDPMTAILLEPMTITKDNLSVVINTSMYWRQLICGDSLGLDRPELPACQLGPVPAASASSQSQP